MEGGSKYGSRLLFVNMVAKAVEFEENFFTFVILVKKIIYK